MKRNMVLLASLALAACATPARLQTAKAPLELVSAIAAQPHPVALYVTGAGVARPYGTVSGFADADTRRPFTVDTPLRIASNTKTFVAATVLRLWEQGRIDLDAPIAPLLAPSLDGILRADGYDTSRITVRQLLSHSSGLYDQGSDPRFIEAVVADPSHVWTREELVGLTTRYADPQSAPGTEFRYSDTGYILLGDIVERITGLSLGLAVRRELKLNRFGLGSTWWEITEPKPRSAPDRARQFIPNAEATNIHPSMDLYGGGGLLMSARDLATLTAALFEGRIFDRPETLREMLWQGPHRGAEQYRLGIFVRRVNGREFYWHGGFWGTLVYYAPDTRMAVSAVTTHQSGWNSMVPVLEQTIGARAPRPAAASGP